MESDSPGRAKGGSVSKQPAWIPTPSVLKAVRAISDGRPTDDLEMLGDLARWGFVRRAVVGGELYLVAGETVVELMKEEK